MHITDTSGIMDREIVPQLQLLEIPILSMERLDLSSPGCSVIEKSERCNN